jgi:hypothetical protein
VIRAADFGHEFVKQCREKDRLRIGPGCRVLRRCHSDPCLMHQFNAALPTDQLAEIQGESAWVLLLVKHDDRAPTCI